MDKLVVTVLRGAREGVRQVLEGDAFAFGRRRTSSVWFPEADDTVSGTHCEVVREAGRWVLRDLGSLNGTWIGDRRLEAAHLLGPSTIFELGRGGPLVRIEVKGEDSEEIGHTAMVKAYVEPGSKRHSTAFYQNLIADTVQRSNRRMKLVILGLSGGFVAIVLVLWLILSRTDKLSEETASVRAAELIANKYAKSVFMLIHDDGARQTGFCTAFAISADGVLATNAHCVRELKDLRALGATGERNADGTPATRSRILARMNTAPEYTWEVVTWKEHPDYDGNDLSPDVALLGLDLRGSTLPVVAEVANVEVARAMAAGQPIFTLGFPGQVMNEARPVADLRAAVVSRLTTRDNTPGDVASAYVVWHSALTSKGTSGSPIFDPAGRVVAINNGGLSAREIVTTDPNSGKTKRFTISEATGLNYGIRADRLADLWVAK